MPHKLPESLTFQEKRYAIAEYYRKNFFDFAKDVLCFDLIPESHRRWEKYITANIDFKELLKGSAGQQFILMEMPRDTYKSTFFTVALAIWALVNEPNLAILITSAAASNSRAWLSIIQKKIEGQNFRLIFGDWKRPYDWRDSDITIQPRTKHRAEASITTAGKDSTVTSKHFDLVLCDDLVNQADRDSPSERIKSIRYIDDVIDLLNKQYGVCIFIGTTWHYADAHQYIEKTLNPKLRSEGRKEFKIYKEPVYYEKDGQTIYNFPELFSPERCQEVRSKKSDFANFAANYLLKPLNPQSQIFREEGLQFFDYHSDFPKGIKKIFVHIDPSGGEKETSDFTAVICVGKRESDGKILVLDTRIDQVRPSGREEMIYALWEYYHAFPEIEQLWQIETVANQAEIKRSLLTYMTEKKKVASFPLKAKARVANKVAKITSLELPISNGTLLFRRDWQTAPGGYRILIQQLLEFPLGHDDGPDALKEAMDLCDQRGVPKFAEL